LCQHVALREVNTFRGTQGTARVDDAEEVVGANGLNLVIDPAEVAVAFGEFLALVDKVVPVDAVFGQFRCRIDADDKLEPG